MNNIDFGRLSSSLLIRAMELLPQWLPGGRLVGNEFTCGNIDGSPGNSLKVNINTGIWADFAGDISGGDLIDLYSKIKKINLGDSARELMKYYDSSVVEHKKHDPVDLDIIMPPNDAVLFAKTPSLGDPSYVWTYKDFTGNVLFHVARYDQPCAKKVYIPWSYSKSKKQFVQKAWPSPRPLYGLEYLAARPKHKILIVEGEKAADAARKIIGEHYNVVSWAGGAKAFNTVDWTPIYGKEILIWPDNDIPGIDAMNGLADFLSEKCSVVKLVNMDMNDEEFMFTGMDAADLKHWTANDFISWAKPRILTIAKPKEIKVFENPKTFHGEITESVLVKLEKLQKLGLKVSKNGMPECHLSNVCTALENYEPLKGSIWYDDYSERIYSDWNYRGVREWRDEDNLSLAAYLQKELGFSRVTATSTFDSVRLVAWQNRKHGPMDWMNSLAWDGIPRVPQFFKECFGAPDNEYVTKACTNWWIGMVARIYEPGCKVDNMVIFEGGQGRYKSTALSILADKWFSESTESITSKDFYLLLQGNMIVEVAELDSFSKAETTRIKQVVSCRIDRYRKPYAINAQDYPRKGIIVGTTNEKTYLKDSTGGRRFWPIKVGKIDLQKIEDLRVQLFAEAVHYYKSKISWWEMPEEITAAEQEARYSKDDWEDSVVAWLGVKSEVTIPEICDEHLEIPLKDIDRNVSQRLSKILSRCGYENISTTRDGRKVRRWLKKPQPGVV